MFFIRCIRWHFSFGGVNDQCGATSWAVQETGILSFLSCDSDIIALKGQVEGSGVSEEEEEDLVIPKLQVIQKIS